MDANLIDALARVVGPRGIVRERTRRVPYESDGLAIMHHVPDVVVLPRDTRETSECMKLAAAAGVPLVTRGAGTGLSGGATPVEGGVLLATARMRDVIEVNVEDRFARVQAGVVNADLSHACEAHGLFYAPDPSSQKACTIG